MRKATVKSGSNKSKIIVKNVSNAHNNKTGLEESSWDNWSISQRLLSRAGSRVFRKEDKWRESFACEIEIAAQ